MLNGKGLKLGNTMPRFVLKGADGRIYHSTDWKGQYVLLMFHRGTWCPNSRRQLLQLSDHYSEFEENGVTVAAVLGQKKETVHQYLAKSSLPFPVLIDETREVIKAFDVFHFIGVDAYKIARPSLFLISPEQKIVYEYVGRHQADLPKQDKLMTIVRNIVNEQ